MVAGKPFSVKIPENTRVTLEDKRMKIAGSKGELVQVIVPSVVVNMGDREIIIENTGESKKTRALSGLMRALITNALIGVNEGFSKTLELSGVGYRAQVSGDTLTLSIGFSHPVIIKAPAGISFSVAENKIIITGIDKQLVGQIAHSIRSTRPPEPYKGKGIKYVGERIRRKAGKAAVKTTGAK